MLRTLGWVLVTAGMLGACGGSAPATKLAATRPATQRAERAPAPLEELEPQVVARAIRGNELTLRECFAGADGRPVRGFMRMTFRVNPSGDVDEVDVESSSFAEAGVFECLSERVAALHFDARADARRARWTFASGLAESQQKSGSKAKKRAKKRGGSEEGVVIDEKSRDSLSAGEVEEVVQAGFGLFAHCYREAIGRHPRLSGAVRLRMVIGRDGLVDEMADASSEIADAEIIDCVAEGFFALRFPKPRKGTVRLTYRIVFDAS